MFVVIPSGPGDKDRVEPELVSLNIAEQGDLVLYHLLEGSNSLVLTGLDKKDVGNGFAVAYSTLERDHFHPVVSCWVH